MILLKGQSQSLHGFVMLLHKDEVPWQSLSSLTLTQVFHPSFSSKNFPQQSVCARKSKTPHAIVCLGRGRKKKCVTCWPCCLLLYWKMLWYFSDESNARDWMEVLFAKLSNSCCSVSGIRSKWHIWILTYSSPRKAFV